MPNQNFRSKVIQNLSFVSGGTSSVRGQPAGTLQRMRRMLCKVDLEKLKLCDPEDVRKFLNYETRRIEKGMIKPCWGLARKFLNIFLRFAECNRFLCSHYRLSRLRNAFEIPLDSMTAKEIRRSSPRGTLPQWPGLIRLTPQESRRFQERAMQLAKQHEDRIARVDLDLYFWSSGQSAI